MRKNIDSSPDKNEYKKRLSAEEPKMDLLKTNISLLSSSDLTRLSDLVKEEVRKRKHSDETISIKRKVKDNGYFLEYDRKRGPIDGLICGVIEIPVNLSSDCRSKYNDEIDAKAEEDRWDDENLPEWIELPEFKNKDFERTGKWEAGDWDEAYTAKGKTKLNIWYKPFVKGTRIGIAYRLDTLAPVFFLWSLGEEDYDLYDFVRENKLTKEQMEGLTDDEAFDLEWGHQLSEIKRWDYGKEIQRGPEIIVEKTVFKKIGTASFDDLKKFVPSYESSRE